MKAKILVVALCGVFATAAQAEGVGVYVNGGTTGFGLGVAGNLSESVTGRIGFNTWSKTVTQNDSDGNYNLDLKLQTINLLADWYPFSGTFRTTLGLVSNGNKATVTATPSAGGTYEFNNHIYTASEFGSYTGEMKFNSTAPYLGVGWGNPVARDKTWGFVMDLGVMFQGSPKVTSTATCGPALNVTDCQIFQNDVAASTATLEEDTKDFKYWPVISIGVSYHF
ncbi:MAG: hypothetical protein KKH12_12245 [Gammaproteobacteria bacterium]|nr:hypothetical protein [Gammaproteobacteria bacterium]MBU1482424.1 hypothetical protein [Gammaproteobacteria bacterium]